MQRSRLLFASAVLVAAAAPGWADGALVSYAVHHDTSPPLSEMVKQARPELPTGLSKEIPNRVSRRQQEWQGRPQIDQADPLLALGGAGEAAVAATPAPSLVFDGATDADNNALLGFAVVPPDTEGDVSPSHYFQWVNLIYRIYNKAGQLVLGPARGNTFWSGFGGACQTENSGDPLVLWDHYADRWVVSQFTTGGAGLQCVAVSTTSDPTGSYHRYSFQVAAVGNIPDYPKMGIWSDSYAYAQDEFAFTFDNARACAFERTPMLSGQVARSVCRDFPCTNADCPFGVLPADLEGTGKPADAAPIPFFMYHDREVDGTVANDGIRVWNLNLTWSNPNAATLTNIANVPGAALDRELCGFSRSCVPQPSPGEGLDTLSAKTMWRAHYRLEDGFDSVLLNTTVDVGGNRAGIRWAEMHKTGATWSIFQEGTHAPADGLHRWMASAAKDDSGNICLGYSVSSSSVFPSVRYACRSEGDPLGTLPGGEVTMKAGTGSQTSSANRWGDYSSLTIDESNGCSFWFTNEYYATNSSFNFKTSIGTWTFPSCGGAPSFVITSITPGLAGQNNTWNVTGATPNGLVRVRCQPQGGGPMVNVGTDTADANGDAAVVALVPGSASGMTVDCVARDDVSGSLTPAFTETF